MERPEEKMQQERTGKEGGRDFLSGFLAGGEKPAGERSVLAAPAAMEAEKDGIFPDETKAALRSAVIDAISEIYDPEIPVNIYELGLIYGIEIDERKCAHVTMTLTTPHCPVAETMPGEVETRVRMVEGIEDCEVHLVWDPKWDASLMSEAARLELGLL